MLSDEAPIDYVYLQNEKGRIHFKFEKNSFPNFKHVLSTEYNEEKGANVAMRPLEKPKKEDLSHLRYSQFCGAEDFMNICKNRF